MYVMIEPEQTTKLKSFTPGTSVAVLLPRLLPKLDLVCPTENERWPFGEGRRTHLTKI